MIYRGCTHLTCYLEGTWGFLLGDPQTTIGFNTKSWSSIFLDAALGVLSMMKRKAPHFQRIAGDDFWDLLRRLGDCYVNDLQNRGPALNDELLVLAASTCVYKPVINEIHKPQI